jgi:hypothetical protein
MYSFHNSLLIDKPMESLQVRKRINKPNPFGLGMLQMVLEPPSNARSCGIGALHDVGLTRTS